MFLSYGFLEAFTQLSLCQATLCTSRNVGRVCEENVPRVLHCPAAVETRTSRDFHVFAAPLAQPLPDQNILLFRPRAHESGVQPECAAARTRVILHNGLPWHRRAAEYVSVEFVVPRLLSPAASARRSPVVNSAK